MQSEQIAMLRALKGNALSCAVALALAGQPATKTELADWTGYDDEAAARGLRVLVSLALAIVIPYGRHPRYQLTTHATQLLFSWAQVTPDNPESGLPRGGGGGDHQLAEIAGPPPPPAEVTPEKPESTAIVDALDDAGIGEPKRSQLAALAWITPAYIAAHVGQVEREGHNLSLAIWRMEQHWRQPKQPRSNDKYLDYLQNDPEETSP